MSTIQNDRTIKDATEEKATAKNTIAENATDQRKVIDDNSRDYDFKDIEADPRFTQTTREFWITMGAYIGFAALLIANLLLLNGSTRRVLGFPLWIFLEILIIVGFVVMVIILATYVYKDMDITPDGEIHENKKGRDE